MKFSTQAIRAGQDPESKTGAVVVPVYQNVTFQFVEVGKHTGYEYTRTGNPTRTALEQCLAALENAPYGITFSSGSAATDAALSILKSGDHVVSGDHIYGGTWRIFESLYRPRGIDFTYAKTTDPASFEAALTPKTKMVWVETPTNPLLHLIDLRALAAICKPRGILLVVDNTFASPYFQRPLELGADVVLHSATKYIGGHSDVLGGAIVVRDENLNKAYKTYQNAVGAVPGPWDSWLMLRGLKTLAIRMREHEANSLRIAKYLEGHTRVKRVWYPGLPSHPQHALAKAQMDGFGGIVSFEIDGGRADVNRFVKALRIFIFAESLGGVESLVCHPCTMSHGMIAVEEREKIGITEGLIRLSVGIEDSDDLIEDLERGFGSLSG